ncbi:MAG: hypothetical protein Q8R37_02695 [Nanoarchaeota archaeon]|nr:hypothetical protein [Nanoarchaeota archaeon]
MEPLTPSDTLATLTASPLFKDWKKEHADSYLSHFFCPMSKVFQPSALWDVGYFNPQDQKITVFRDLGTSFERMPEEDVFKKESTAVEPLNMKKVVFPFAKAATFVHDNVSSLFPKEQCGDGFLILQNVSNTMLWNFTFISASLKFLNVKINAKDGKLYSHQEVNVVQRE